MKFSNLILFVIFSISLKANTGDIQKAKGFLSTSRWAFEENRGQVTGADSALVTYFYKKGDMTMFLTKTGIAYQFEKTHYPEGYRELNRISRPEDRDKMVELSKQIKTETYRMDIELLGANTHAQILREGESPDYIQYYNHNVLGVHSYQKITYKNIYPNIDWVVYISTNPQNIKYDFIVHPGGNPDDIKLQTKWVEDLKLNTDGSLLLQNRMGSILENKPYTYQNNNSEVSSKFILVDSLISFQLGSYDHLKPLIIDPSIAWATYYGGSDQDDFRDCKVDGLGNVYACGNVFSTNTYLASGGYQMTNLGPGDLILVKFSSDGARLWASFYGGSGHESNPSCLVDKSNNIYLIGTTSSTTNIATSGSFKPTLAVVSTFLAKFNPNGIRQWGTYFGERLFSSKSCIDINDNIFITGWCNSLATQTAFNGHQLVHGGGSYDAFLVKFSSSGARIWATFYGDTGTDYGHDCSVDQLGNVYLSGSTQSSNNIAFNGFLNTKPIGCSTNPSCDYPYLVKFSSTGTRLWGTYYGDSLTDIFQMRILCETDKNNDVYIVGASSFKSMITNYDGFDSANIGSYPTLVKFNSSGARIWAQYLKDSNSMDFYDIFIDDSINIYICGIGYEAYNLSYHKLIKNSFQLTHSGNSDGIILKLKSNGIQDWGAFIGGSGYDLINTCTLSKNNELYICGITDTGKYYGPPPSSPYLIKYSSNIGYRGFQNLSNGKKEGILVKICTQTDTPKLSITSDLGLNICSGVKIKFTATPTLGGDTPHYTWYRNNIKVGTDSADYTAIYNSTDTIQCKLKTKATCLSIDSAWSSKLIIKLKLADTTQRFDTICSNQSYPFNSQLLNTTGIYKDTFTSSSGCDSFIFLHLEVKPFSFSSYNHTTTCTNPSYFFNNQTFTQSGAYKDTFIAANGCDSIVTVFLTVKGNTSFNLPPVSLCPGQSYFFNGLNRSTAGLYSMIIPNASGCDSTINLDLKILTTPSGVNNIIWACNPYIFKGKTYTSNVIVIDTVKSSYGCDSLYRFNYIYLKSAPITLSNIPITVCDSVKIKNIVHKASFSFTDTTRTTQNVVCDSLYQTTNYTIKYTPTITLSTKQEDTFFKGENITISANNIKNYRWSTGETKRDISFKLTQNESFYLIAWNDAECRDTAYTNITALDATILEFPTGFSPMSKKPENQVFRPNIVGKIERIQLDIFNRLGEKIYSSSNPSTLGWDGTYKGVASPQGVYTYLIEYVTNKQIFFKSGEVELVR